MSGYHNFSMSNNAVEAYNRGLKPASKIKGIPSALVKHYCTPQEWHHSSLNYNRTDFYDPIMVRAVFGLEVSEEYNVNPLAVAALAKYGVKAEVHENCNVRWLEWEGSLKNAKCTKRAATGCRVEVKGVTAYVTLPQGEIFTKRLSTRGFYWAQHEQSSFRPAGCHSEPALQLRQR